jgi:hypothetical protein
MLRKISVLICAVVLSIVSKGWAADNNWTNSAGERLWRTASNWSLGTVPGSDDKAAIRNPSISGPIIDANTTAAVNEVVVGDWNSPSDSLTMTGGSLSTAGANPWIILGYSSANNGTFTISAGTVTVGDTFYVGLSGTGTLNMTGGTITVTNGFGIAQKPGSHGTVSLHGGTINCGTFAMTSGATMDVTTGKLVITGNAASDISTWYKTNHWITAYGGKGKLSCSYNSETNKTTVTATPPAAKASSPSPAAGATKVPPKKKS